jgi:hypothetical protein
MSVLLQELLYIIVYTGLINSFRKHQLGMRELLMPIDTAEESAAAAGYCSLAQSVDLYYTTLLARCSLAHSLNYPINHFSLLTPSRPSFLTKVKGIE